MTGIDHINYHYIISLPVLDENERVISDFNYIGGLRCLPALE